MASLRNHQKFWKKQFEKEYQAKQLLIKSLKLSAAKATQMLGRQFGAKKVFLFGSIIDGELFHKHSDLDLAVEGIQPQEYISALSKISRLFAGKVSVDLVPLEDAAPKLKDLIQKKGQLIYG